MDIKILQLSEENESKLFMSWDWIYDSFDINHYNVIWDGSLEALGVVPSTNNIWNLNKIYDIFNINRPSDFCGHSLSVSDIVMIDDKYFYCDSFGWHDINDKD